MNRLFDRLGHGDVELAGRRVSLFMVCELTGIFLGLAAVILLGLGKGLPLVMLAAVAMLCVLAYALPLALHRLFLGTDSLVVMEHLWAGLLLISGFLLLVGGEPFAYLDPVAVGIALGLCCGRVGCSMAGCCHGLPSAWGIRYPVGSWGIPSSRWRNGLRLFPVQLLDALSLLVIAIGAVLLVLFSQPGAALIWFLAAYAVMRFSTEFLRGDQRPEFLGMSQAQWMSVVQLGVALIIDPSWQGEMTHTLVLVLTGLGLIAGVSWLAYRSIRNRFTWKQATQLRNAVVAAGEALPPDVAAKNPLGQQHVPARPMVEKQSNDLAVIAKWGEAGRSLRLSIRDDRFTSMRIQCRCIAAAMPELEPETAVWGKNSVLHLVLPWPVGGEPAKADEAGRKEAQIRGDWIYSWALRNGERRRQAVA